MSKRTRKGSGSKVAKPHDDFPLFKHAAGVWAKKVRGRLHHFGPWKRDPKGTAALAKWLDVKDALLAGRTPRPKAEGLALKDLCNAFLRSKRALLGAAHHGSLRICRR